MASRAHEGGASALPDLAAMLAAIPSLPRPILARLTARMVDRLDEIDGDPDLEGENDEDVPDFRRRSKRERAILTALYGPGCKIADPGGCEHDGREPEGVLAEPSATTIRAAMPRREPRRH